MNENMVAKKQKWELIGLPLTWVILIVVTSFWTVDGISAGTWATANVILPFAIPRILDGLLIIGFAMIWNRLGSGTTLVEQDADQDAMKIGAILGTGICLTVFALIALNSGHPLLTATIVLTVLEALCIVALLIFIIAQHAPPISSTTRGIDLKDSIEQLLKPNPPLGFCSGLIPSCWLAFGLIFGLVAGVISLLIPILLWYLCARIMVVLMQE